MRSSLAIIGSTWTPILHVILLCQATGFGVPSAFLLAPARRCVSVPPVASTATLSITSLSLAKDSGSSEDQQRQPNLSHADIIWKLKPPPPPSSQNDDDEEQEVKQKEWKQGDFVIARPPENVEESDEADNSYLLWLSSVRAAVQTVSIGERQVVLEAWIKDDRQEDDKTSGTTPPPQLTKAGRFGITVQSGPPHPLIQETIQDLFGSSSSSNGEDGGNGLLRTAAIIYMFIEPAHRGRNLGRLALEVIAFLHGSVADCDYTMLVADDSGTGQLVAWYEREGDFVRAPALQDLMGSPNEAFGISMIGPTSRTATKSTLTESSASTQESAAHPPPPPPADCTIEWYYNPDLVS